MTVEIVKLESGEEVSATIGQEAFSSITELYQYYPTAFLELVYLARDPSYAIGQGSLDILVDKALVNERGKVHMAIKSVILSAVHGDGMDLYLDDHLYTQ